MVTREEAKSCVGKGWASIIDHLYDHKNPDVPVDQVKEKFGGLRFYTYGHSETYRALICLAEAKSYETCEECGEPGELGTPGGNRHGYYKTLCKGCGPDYKRPERSA